MTIVESKEEGEERERRGGRRRERELIDVRCEMRENLYFLI